VSLIVQNLLAQYTGQSGIAKVGQIRNLSNILTSLSSFGVFNGIVKYVSEYKNNEKGLTKLFSTVFVISSIATISISVIIFIYSKELSSWLFLTEDYYLVFHILSVIVPFIAMNRIFNGIISGLSAYKVHAKIEVIWYLIASIFLLISLYYYNIEGVLIAIAVTPLVQFLVLTLIFGKTINDYVKFKKLSLQTPLVKVLLGFSLISFVATVCLNFVEINFRTLISEKISENEAGIWTAMSSISKIYMQFLITVFSIYILPKYTSLNFSHEFKNEVKAIYKTLLPIVVLGMLFVFFSKKYLILSIYNESFLSMTILFKWQLLADLVRFIANILSFKFLAKKQIKHFVSTQLIGLTTYLIMGNLLIDFYLVEGLVMALFFSNLIYLIVVLTVLRKDLFYDNRPI
jgi:PST family polysaccharide transporter